ncbi:hypothetical protein HMPREF8577_0125 [Streptococcus parasanguinis ATCC 903]|nr:hypothetical protein HMPREF8577_0125 [Streptococcus parasanguinis ATCC 903]
MLVSNFLFSYQVLLDDSILSKKDESKMNEKRFFKKFFKKD